MESNVVEVFTENGATQITNPTTVKSLIDGGQKIIFKMQGTTKLSAGKSMFPSNWNIEDIAEAGRRVMSEKRIVELPNRKQVYQSEVEIRGKKLTIQAFTDGSSWYPIF